MNLVHHSAICVRDVDRSLRFWRDGMGFEVMMDERYEGDWPTLFGAPSTSLRAIFLGRPSLPDGGIVELVDLGLDDGSEDGPVSQPLGNGFVLLSVLTEVDATLQRLSGMGLGGEPARIDAYGVAMATVRDPDGVLVELVDTGAAAHLETQLDR